MPLPGDLKIFRETDPLRALVDNGLLEMHYQPIVEVPSGDVFGYEALARWSSPHSRSTADLLDAALETGRMGELGRLLRAEAIRGCPEHVLFVNLHPKEFDYGWIVRPDDPIFRHRRQVYLEVTESVPISAFEQCHSVLTEVRKKGLQLAIDDLGAGYSNLKYIAELDPNVVKIDRELVAGVEEGSREAKLLAAIVDLCKSMGAKVVAEGIETAHEYGVALDSGVDYCQGYFVARPAKVPPASRLR